MPPPPNTTVAPPHCGDGTVDADEECDDGGTAGGDGCSSTCKNEGMATTMRCQHNSDCHFHFHCHPHSGTCGDGTVGAGEECDDGNTASGDGCSLICKDEGLDPISHIHSHAANCQYITKTIFSGTCGDGIVGSGEACDDGNTASGDGCSPTCKNEGAPLP